MYLNVDETESGLKALANTYPDTCELIQLPHTTHDGRKSYALRLGKQGTQKITGVYFTGGTHAREWGGVDSCIYFAADLLAAYASGTGLQYGHKGFSSVDVRSIIESLEVFVFACVNPDGRAYDMQGMGEQPELDYSLWRKNRRPHEDQFCEGVDLNRNQDFLWDSNRHMHPIVANTASYPNPCGDVQDTYRGPSPTSEPEARNVTWLLETFPQIAWYMDIHCYTGVVLYPWGDAANQSNNPGMNFRNPLFDGQRGLNGGAYREYIPIADQQTYILTAQQVAEAMNAVHARAHPKYIVSQSYFLDVGQSGEDVFYPTTGTNDDYAYSRHMVDSSKRKVMGFTMEFGFETKNFARNFHPSWNEMQGYIREVDAGMLAFCLVALKTSFPRPRLPEIFGDTFGGVDAGGGGWIVLPSGKVIKIPPRQEFILEALNTLVALSAANEINGDVGRQLVNQTLAALEQITTLERQRLA